MRRWYAIDSARALQRQSDRLRLDIRQSRLAGWGLRRVGDRGGAAGELGPECSHSSWTISGQSPYFLAYKAAQVKLGDKGFLSRDITVLDLLMNRSDVHHVYPRNHLKKQGLSRGRYNQIANFVLAQSEINIAIGDKAPEQYFKELAEQCAGGKKKYGGSPTRPTHANLA